MGVKPLNSLARTTYLVRAEVSQMHEGSVFLLLLITFQCFFLSIPVDATTNRIGSYMKYDVSKHLVEVKVNLTSSVPIQEVTLQYYYANWLETPVNVSMQFLEQSIVEGLNSTLWGVEILAPATSNMTLVARIFVVDSFGHTTESELGTESMSTVQKTESSVGLTPFGISLAIATVALIIISIVLIRNSYRARREKTNCRVDATSGKGNIKNSMRANARAIAVLSVVLFRFYSYRTRYRGLLASVFLSSLETLFNDLRCLTVSPFSCSGLSVPTAFYAAD